MEAKKNQKKKPSNHKKSKPKVTNTWWDEYKHLGSWKMRPYNQNVLKEMATKLIEYAWNTERLCVEAFWFEMGISTSSFQNLRRQCPELEEAYQLALEILAMRREQAVHDGKADRIVISWRQPLYSKSVKEVEEWRSKLKEKQATAGASNYTIEMTPIDRCDEVPEKEDA